MKGRKSKERKEAVDAEGKGGAGKDLGQMSSLECAHLGGCVGLTGVGSNGI